MTNTATSPRDLIVNVLAEMDKHLSSVDHYEQTADAVFAVLAPELAIAIYAATDLPWDELIVEARNVTSQWLARGAQLDALRAELDVLTKPNPWFTPAAEFPIEAAERADRERPSIGYAFQSKEHRDEAVIHVSTTPDPDWRERFAAWVQNRGVIAFGGEQRDRLLNGEWTEAEVTGDDERTVRIPGSPSAPCCELHFQGGCAKCGGAEEGL